MSGGGGVSVAAQKSQVLVSYSTLVSTACAFAFLGLCGGIGGHSWANCSPVAPTNCQLQGLPAKRLRITCKPC